MENAPLNLRNTLPAVGSCTSTFISPQVSTTRWHSIQATSTRRVKIQGLRISSLHLHKYDKTNYTDFYVATSQHTARICLHILTFHASQACCHPGGLVKPSRSQGGSNAHPTHHSFCILSTVYFTISSISKFARSNSFHSHSWYLTNSCPSHNRKHLHPIHPIPNSKQQAIIPLSALLPPKPNHSIPFHSRKHPTFF